MVMIMTTVLHCWLDWAVRLAVVVGATGARLVSMVVIVTLLFIAVHGIIAVVMSMAVPMSMSVRVVMAMHMAVFFMENQPKAQVDKHTEECNPEHQFSVDWIGIAFVPVSSTLNSCPQ